MYNLSTLNKRLNFNEFKIYKQLFWWTLKKQWYVYPTLNKHFKKISVIKI